MLNFCTLDEARYSRSRSDGTEYFTVPRNVPQSDEPATPPIDSFVQRSPQRLSTESLSRSVNGLSEQGFASQMEEREGGSSITSQLSSATLVISDQLSTRHLTHEVQSRPDRRHSAIRQAERNPRFVQRTSSKLPAPIPLEVYQDEQSDHLTLNSVTQGSSKLVKRSSCGSFETSGDGLGPQDSASQVLGRDGRSSRSTMSQLSAVAVAIPDLPPLPSVQETQPHSVRRNPVNRQPEVDSGLRFVQTTPSELSTSVFDVPPAYTAT